MPLAAPSRLRRSGQVPGVLYGTGAEPVQDIGHKFSVYRPTHRKVGKKIELD